MLFEVAIIQNPTKKVREEGGKEALLVPPFYIISENDRSAGLEAMRQHMGKLPEDLSRVEVLVRPF